MMVTTHSYRFLFSPCFFCTPTHPLPPPVALPSDSFVFNITHYLRNFMGFSSDQSISVKLAWNFVGYGSTIFGGLLADCVLGRKRTLLYVAIAYACMTCLAAVSTLPSLTVHVGLPGEPVSCADMNERLL